MRSLLIKYIGKDASIWMNDIEDFIFFNLFFISHTTTNPQMFSVWTEAFRNAKWRALYNYTNSVFSHTKHLQINNQHIFTIVFHFLHILFLQDLLIHSFFPFHMFDHHLAKGLSLSSVHVSGIHSLLIPETRLLYQYSVPGSKHTSSKLLSLPRLFPISLDCLPGFWFLLFSFYALSNDT